MINKQPKGKLQTVSTGQDIDAKQHYDAWAESYNKDLLDEYGYNAHIQAADALAEITCDGLVRIVDLGCGTGLLGEELWDRGFTSIDGVDFLENMLEKARALNVYQRTHQEDLSTRSSLPDDHYDVAICAGLFGAGHLGVTGIREMIRLVHPDGKIVILMNEQPYLAEGFSPYMDNLVQENCWQIISNTRVNYMDALDRPGRLIIASVT